MNKSTKMTPQAFWASIKTMASARSAELQVNRQCSQGGESELLAEISILLSLVSELSSDGVSSLSNTVTIDKALFKELLQLVLGLPDLGSKLATVDVDCCATPADEALVCLKPGDFLLRLNAALRACG